MERYHQSEPIPKAFVWRRLQSLAGIFLSLFIIEHLLTNSRAALFIGDDGKGFIKAVNGIHDLPYLQIIEILFIAAPFALHALWGIKYLFTAKFNSFPTNGSRPYLPYRKNQAYSWQRITSWVLLVGVIAHVVQMRFLNYPEEVKVGDQTYYMVEVHNDEGLSTVAERLGVSLYTASAIETYHASVFQDESQVSAQRAKQAQAFANTLASFEPTDDQVVASAKDFGTADLLVVRNVMQSFWMIGLYSIFVISAVYHAFNGLWTFLITWGITLTAVSQRLARKLSIGLMLLIGFLGLAAAWGTFWINLRY